MQPNLLSKPAAMLLTIVLTIPLLIAGCPGEAGGLLDEAVSGVGEQSDPQDDSPTGPGQPNESQLDSATPSDEPGESQPDAGGQSDQPAEPEPDPASQADQPALPQDDPNAGANSSVRLELELWDAGGFSVQKPKGWDIFTAGSCSELAFVMRDPEEPLRQVLFFGLVGPIYISEAAKQLDLDYVSYGGYAVISYIDAPVIDPLTPENFFAHWPEIAAMSDAQAFMAELPHLAQLEIIGSTPQQSMLPDMSAETALVRGLFTKDDAVGEGLFLGSVWEYLSGTGCGSMICGVTAPKREFAALQASLVEVLESFTVTQEYASSCVAQSQQTWGTIAEAGQTLSESSDIISDGWQQRSQSDDILAEQRSDVMLGHERVYDPETGQVYEVAGGWYDQYNLERNQYELGNLQPLPQDDWSLWTAAPLDGVTNIH